MSEALLQVDSLHVSFPTEGGRVNAVRGVSFEMAAGERLGLVGESGSGKTVTCLSAIGLTPANAEVSGRISLCGKELPIRSPKLLQAIRGNVVSMIFQDPASSFNPFLRIGEQVAEPLVVHRGVTSRAARTRSIEMLEAVRLPDPERVSRSYPHEVSGGMLQRAMIAMALICRPRLLLADEPTTALDVSVQAHIVRLLTDLAQELGVGVLFVTHDLALVSGACDRIAVMYLGKIVEVGCSEDLVTRPRHPYTRGLLASLPQASAPGQRLQSIPGSPPGPRDAFAGCPFAPRCRFGFERCEHERPLLRATGGGRFVACHLEDSP